MTSKTDRMQQMLLAARDTAYYRPRLVSLASIAPRDSPQQTLARLPRLELQELLDRPMAFYNPRAPRRPLRRVFYPAGQAPRIVVLMPGFRQPTGVRTSACGWNWLLPQFRPTVVAAPVARLRELARAAQSRETSPPLEHAVIAFTGIRHGLLSENDRELFWRAFRVPVFEQLLGFGGELLAWECEAHMGLHVVQKNLFVEACRSELLFTSLDCVEFPTLRLATGLAAGLDPEPCACGCASPRLVGLSHKVPVAPNRHREEAAELLLS